MPATHLLVAQFSSEQLAYMAKGMLEENGIESFIDTNIMGTLYGSFGTWSPIRLFVKQADLERARLLLREHGDLAQ